MKQSYTAVVKQDEGWWIGWVVGMPGVNCRGKTKAELLKNLGSALREAIEFNRGEVLTAIREDFTDEPVLMLAEAVPDSASASWTAAAGCRLVLRLQKAAARRLAAAVQDAIATA